MLSTHANIEGTCISTCMWRQSLEAYALIFTRVRTLEVLIRFCTSQHIQCMENTSHTCEPIRFTRVKIPSTHRIFILRLQIISIQLCVNKQYKRVLFCLLVCFKTDVKGRLVDT